MVMNKHDSTFFLMQHHTTEKNMKILIYQDNKILHCQNPNEYGTKVTEPWSIMNSNIYRHDEKFPPLRSSI